MKNKIDCLELKFDQKTDEQINEDVYLVEKVKRDKKFAKIAADSGVSEEDIHHICNPPETIYSMNRPNYCNSWKDMGPIIQREKITIDAPFGKDKNWQASYWSDKTKRFELEADHLNPLRAAAIVYLMMSDEDEK